MPRVQPPALPVFLFHWLFALGVVTAAAIALVLGPEHRLFPSHSTIGLALAGLVVLRILWAIARARRAGRAAAGRGHASAVVPISMYALVLGLAATGLMMTRGGRDLGPAHGLMAYALVAVTGVHIVAVVAKRRGGGGPSRGA